MSSPTVTAVIPAYSAGKIIADAINSTLEQTYAIAEIVVVDDGSSDLTAELIAGLPRQRVVRRCLIVVPCYNEGSRLKSRIFLDYLRDHDDSDFLFVNDGSRDNTLNLLEDLKGAAPERIGVLDLKQNGGKAEAVRLGMLAAIQDGNGIVGFWDADLATPLATIPCFLQQLAANQHLDMIFGSRVRLLGHDIRRRAVRHYLGRVFASVVSVVLRLPVYDTQCGAKLFRVTSRLSQVLNEKFLSRWIFDVEILARFIALDKGDVSYLRQSVYEYPLSSWEDVAGSKVGAADFLKALFDIVRIYRKYLLPANL